MTAQSDNESASSTRTAPTPLGRKLVRYMVGFGVGVGVGLAPYLGLLNVPLFRPLLSLIPHSIRNTVIPLSAALMGTIAVVVQYYAAERVSRAWMRKRFARTLIAALITFLILTTVHTMVVVTVPNGPDEPLAFVVGFTRPLRPPCTEEVSDSECIKLITIDPAAIESFWGDRSIRLAKLSLIFSYLLFTGSFGGLVGLVTLRESIEPSNRDHAER